MSFRSRAARPSKGGAGVRIRPQCEALESRLTPAAHVRFDFSYDTGGMFNDPAKRAALDRAADAVTARMTDSLGAITPSGGNTWTAKVYDSASGQTLKFANPTIPADEIVVFVTSGNIGGALAITNGPGYSASGSSDWFNQIKGRGEAGVANGTDFAPWGGLIAFNTNYAFSSDGTPTKSEFDLESVATHELLHVFGFGMGGASFERYATAGGFTGPNVQALLGGPAPMQADDHFAAGFGLNGVESVVSPSIARGQVKGMTDLEYAALADIGWDESKGATVPPVAVPPVVVPPVAVPPVVVPPVTVPPVVVPPVVPPVTVPPVVVPPVVPPPVVMPPVVPPTVPPVAVKTGRMFTIGSDLGGTPTYTAYDAAGNIVASGLAFSASFRGGVRTATADVNGDGVNDSIVAAGAGSAPHVRVFDGRTGSMTFNFFAFDAAQRGGLRIAAADVDGDGKADIIASLSTGQTRVFSGANGKLLADLLGQGADSLAAGDVNGDGYADVAVSAGNTVSIWDGRSLAAGSPAKLAPDVPAFDRSLPNAATITLADLDGDGMADLIAVPGFGNVPTARVFSGKSIVGGTPKVLSEFLAGDANFRTGARLAAADMDLDGREDIIAVPAIAGFGTLKVYSGKQAATSATPSVIRSMWTADWAAYGSWVG